MSVPLSVCLSACMFVCLSVCFCHCMLFSPNQPTGLIGSSSCNVHPFVCLLLSPSHAIFLYKYFFWLKKTLRRRRWQRQRRRRRGRGGLKNLFGKKENAISPFFDASGNKNIVATIRINWEIWCLPYAGFLKALLRSVSPFWYRCYYLHRSRDSVSLVYRLFSTQMLSFFFQFTKKPILFHPWIQIVGCF